MTPGTLPETSTSPRSWLQANLTSGKSAAARTPTRRVAVAPGEYKELSGLLGFFSPSLPRVLECHPASEVEPPSLLLADCLGEPLADYSRRVGALPVPLACALTLRLALELEAFHQAHPAVARRLDPLHCEVSVWQAELLQLRLGTFERESLTPPPPLTARLLQVCCLLLSGGTASLSDAESTRVPSILLMRLRQVNGAERSAPTWGELKNVLQDALATSSRTLRGSSLALHLALRPHLLPISCALPSPAAASSVRLSRILAHREALVQAEVTELSKRLTKSIAAADPTSVSLQPQHIWIKLPTSLDANDPKSLDLRLYGTANFEVSLQAAPDDFSWAASPITAAEAAAEGLPFEDLRQEAGRQQVRLIQHLLSGSHSLRIADAAPQGSLEASEAKGAAEVKPTQNPLAAAFAPSQNPLAAAFAPSQNPLAAAFAPSLASNPLAAAFAPAQQARDLLAAVAQDLAADAVQLPMRPIVLTLGSGGTGKSMLARMLYDFASLDQREGISLFDCDVEGNRDFQKIAPEKIQSIDVASHSLMHLLVDAANPQQPVLADLPSSCLQRFAQEMSPEIIQQLQEEAGIVWLPVHLVTARASSVPLLLAWRRQVWGDIPAVIVISQKDGSVPASLVEQVVRPQDTVIRLPQLDPELATATDIAATTWKELIQPGRPPQSAFANPLLKMQLKKKRDEFEKALRPLVEKLAPVVVAD